MTTKYENSPPPSDFEFEDIPSPPFFSLSRPQNVVVRGFLSVDLNLIHPHILGVGMEDDTSNKTIENNINKAIQEEAYEDVNTNADEKAYRLNISEIKAAKDLDTNANEKAEQLNISDFKDADQNTKLLNVTTFLKEYFEKTNFNRSIGSANKDVDKENRKNRTERESFSKMHDKSPIALRKRKQISSGTKKKKCCRHHQYKRSVSSVDSDESVIDVTTVEMPRYELSYKPKLHKCSKIHKNRKRISVCDNDQSSNSDRSKTFDYSRKSKRYRSFSSYERPSLLNRHNISLHNSRYRHSGLRTPEFRIKPELFPDVEHVSYSGRKRLESHRFSEGDEDKNLYNRSRNRSYSPSQNRLYNPSRNRFFSPSRNRLISQSQNKSHSPERKQIQDIKCEPMDSKEFNGPDSYYCPLCKLNLNSELTWQSHLLGEKHRKAKRAQSVRAVARSSLLTNGYIPAFEESKRHNKPAPGKKRIEIKKHVSSIQEVCDELQHKQLLIGLRNMWEIRGEAETNYYCNLCDAPCGPSSVMPHLTGFKHKLQCLKEYFPQLYDRHKDDHKRVIERIMEEKFAGYGRLFRREKIRVFKDIPVSNLENTNAFPDDQPGPSWKTASKEETVIIKDENGKAVVPSNQEFLDTGYADFHCTVCDSHMNNVSMWEAHIRGRRHLKNVKKAPEGVASTNKYIEAPPGTVSNLVKQIKKVCTSGEIIVGLKYIRENQGKHGNQYNCFPCGGCCSDLDIVDHILSMKHKIKYLEKMDADGFNNSIVEINNLHVNNYYREQMVDEECMKMVEKYGRGKPKVYYIKRDLVEYGGM